MNFLSSDHWFISTSLAFLLCWSLVQFFSILIIGSFHYYVYLSIRSLVRFDHWFTIQSSVQKNLVKSNTPHPPSSSLILLLNSNSMNRDSGSWSRLKSTILHSKWTLLKSCCFFLISLRSITNLAHDFKSPFLDIEITIVLTHFMENSYKNRLS